MRYACAECGASFEATSGKAKWCEGCREVELACEACGKRFRRHRKFPVLEHAYCGLACSRARVLEGGRHRHGRDNNRYNGGVCFSKRLGRWVICCIDGTLVYYYRAVMEAELGRPLRAEEIVHHINGDTTDDRIDNLRLMSRAEHVRLHASDA